ncbi:MAG TPA: hypothetical protein VLC95_06015 [Anaerolineae bacterium]|nr:hypothetical protein [Anaerolineae bacterium]
MHGESERTVSQQIGTLNEGPLHAALKAWYARPGDALEVQVSGYVVDIVRGDLLIEVQTGSFAAIKNKLLALTAVHPLRLVYPVPRDRWLVRVDAGGTRLSRRKSPKHGGVEDVFAALVSFPHLLARPNFSLDVVVTREEEIRRHEPGRAWRRRGWVTVERRLLEVVDHRLFETPASLAGLLPTALPDPFTTADLARALGRPRWLAQKMAYCLRHMDLITPDGHQGRSVLYTRPNPPRS